MRTDVGGSRALTPRFDNVVEYGPNLVEEKRRIFAHRKMTEATEGSVAGAGYHRSELFSLGGRAAPIVFAVENVHRAKLGIDRVCRISHIVVDGVVVKVALKHGWCTLAIYSTRFMAQRFRTRWGHHAVH